MSWTLKGLQKCSVLVTIISNCFCLFLLMIVAFILLPNEKFGFFNSYTSHLRNYTVYLEFNPCLFIPTVTDRSQIPTSPIPSWPSVVYSQSPCGFQKDLSKAHASCSSPSQKSAVALHCPEDNTDSLCYERVLSGLGGYKVSPTCIASFWTPPPAPMHCSSHLFA